MATIVGLIIGVPLALLVLYARLRVNSRIWEGIPVRYGSRAQRRAVRRLQRNVRHWNEM